MKVKYIVMLVIFVGSFWGGNFIFSQYANQKNQAAEAATLSSLQTQPIPNFTLPDLDGVKHNIHEWDGKVIVLNFWATWCPPCRKETPMFVELQEQYGARGLQFIGIAIDAKQPVQDFVDTFGVNYPTLIGADDAIKVSAAYGNRLGGLPFTVVIDRKGVIQYVKQGEFKRKDALRIIKPLL